MNPATTYPVADYGEHGWEHLRPLAYPALATSSLAERDCPNWTHGHQFTTAATPVSFPLSKLVNPAHSAIHIQPYDCHRPTVQFGHSATLGVRCPNWTASNTQPGNEPLAGCSVSNLDTGSREAASRSQCPNWTPVRRPASQGAFVQFGHRDDPSAHGPGPSQQPAMAIKRKGC